MPLPSQIVIGPVTYAVKEVDNLLRDGDPILGTIKYKAATIEVDAGMPDAVKLVTLVHEALHGILHHAGVKHSEGVVQAISYGLVDLMARNGWTIDLGGDHADDA